MDLPCAATATCGASSYAVDSNPHLAIDRRTDEAPRLYSRQPEFGASLLPDELVGEVFNHLPLEDLASSYQVCRRWNGMEKSTGWAGAARAFTAWSLRAGLAPMRASAFHDALGRASRLSAGCRGEALERLAAKLPCLPAADWKQCLASLVQQAARCPAHDYHRVLGAIVGARITRDGNFHAWANPAMSAHELFNESWEVGSRLPVFPIAAQAIMLAALCHYLKPTNYAVDTSKTVVKVALSWMPAQLDREEEGSLAMRLWNIAILNLQQRDLLECLGHFNMHRLPFMTNAYPGRKTEAEIAAAAGLVMRFDLDRRKRLDMLLHRDERGVPWLHHPCAADHSRQIKAYAGAMKRLGLSTAERAYLFAAKNLSSRPVLSVLLCRGVQTGNMKEALDCMDTLINEAGLPEAETVALLRSHFQRKPDAEFQDGDARTGAFPDFCIGPSRLMPFNGLSAIDSLFCDRLGARMKEYMNKILASPLSDAAKRDVLRLDFPDRSDFLRMSRALRIYCSTVRESSLPESMKQELTSPLRTQFDPNCSLI